jgi:hypothetical protein
VAVAAIRCFYCACCGALVRLCSRCDRGQVTCGVRCRALRRRESLRAATSRPGAAGIDTPPASGAIASARRKK